MPPCRISSRKHLQKLDIPVFPFLAPSLFKPWPKSFRHCSVHTTTPATEASTVNSGYKTPQIIIRQARQQRYPSDGIQLPLQRPQLRPDAKSESSVSDGGDGGEVTQRASRQALMRYYSVGRLKSRPIDFSRPLVDRGDGVMPANITAPIFDPGCKDFKRKFRQLPLGTAGIYRPPFGRGGNSTRMRFKTRKHDFKCSQSRHHPPGLVGCQRFTHRPRGRGGSPMGTLRFKQNDLSAEPLRSLWSLQFILLSQKHRNQLSRHKARLPVQLRWRLTLADRTLRALAKSLPQLSCQEISVQWKALSLLQRQNGWSGIMLNALHENPGSALKFLAASSSKPYPPNYAIRDSIDYIVNWFLYDVKDPNAKDVTALFQTVTGAVNHFEHGYFNLTQKAIFLLVRHLTIDQAEQFYTILVQSGQLVYRHTLLHFVDVFARAGRTSKAVEVLRRFHECGGVFTNPRVESVCSTLLQREYRNSSELGPSDSELFALMLNLGLQPNIITYNILVQNSVTSGDSETAWQIHDMMLSNGISADTHTYSILLNDAKVRMDRSAIDRILDLVESKNLMNEYILNDLLHAIFLLHYEDRRKDPIGSPVLQAPFKRMLPLFAEYFDIEPIKDLLTPQYKDFAVHSERTKMRPSKESLVVMFVGLVREFTDPRSTYQWYKSFSTMVLDRNPYIAPLAESSRIYDAVIMSFGQWSTSLHLCTKVLRDMLARFSVAQDAQKRSDIPDKVLINLDIALTPEGDYTLGEKSSVAQSRNHSIGRTQFDKASTSSTNDTDGIQSEVPAIAKVGSTASDNTISLSPTRFGTAHEASVPLPEGILDTELPARGHEGSFIFRHCKPSVWTWTVLLKSFIDNNQPRAAEKVLAMMISQGTKPNIVTWNCLVSGYVGMQDIANTVSVIERLEDEGLKMDQVTIRLLSRILDREALIEALDQKDERRAEIRNRIEDPIEGRIEDQIRTRIATTVEEDLSEGITKFVDGAGSLQRSGAVRDSSGPQADETKPPDLDGTDVAFPADDFSTEGSSLIRLVRSTSSLPDSGPSTSPAFRRFHRY